MPEDENLDQKDEKKKSQKAEPIKSLKDVSKIIKKIKGLRNKLLFVIGVNTGLRLGMILKLRVGDAKEILKAGQEGSPYKPNSETWKYFQINKAIVKELEKYLTENPSLKNEDYLFESQKGKEALTSKSASRLIKKWTKEAGLKGNYGCESLRKTFGYHQRVQYSVGFDVLCKMFGHENPADTAKFLGISKDTPLSILKNEIVQPPRP